MATKTKAVKSIKIKIPKGGKLPKVPTLKGGYKTKKGSAVKLKFPKL